jgi:hypothetical protein
MLKIAACNSSIGKTIVSKHYRHAFKLTMKVQSSASNHAYLWYMPDMPG